MIENEAVDGNEHGGPFGAKGVGESGTFGVSPAIANAIDDAVGVRITTPAADGRGGVPRNLRRARRAARGPELIATPAAPHGGTGDA